MILVQFWKGSYVALGVKTEAGVIDVEAVVEKIGVPGEFRPPATTVHTLLHSGVDGLADLARYVEFVLGQATDGIVLSEDSVRIAPCVTDPEKILCVGLNYRNHVKEWVFDETAVPTIFSKFNNALSADGDVIALPAQSKQVDYEAELALVIGKEARNVSEDEALNHVFGYFNANDLSSRDLQFQTTQWLVGKTCDGFCPIGPYLVTADEIPDPHQLGIRCFVNGEKLQDSNTSFMIFTIPKLISFLSEHMTLKPGDVILTGTPDGVALGMPEGQQKWLKAGDVVTVEIDRLGKLSNTMH